MFQNIPYFVFLLFITVTSSFFTVRFVKRYELPVSALRAGVLVPGLAALGLAYFGEFDMKWLFSLFGAAGIAMGLFGVGVVLWATRRSGLQPRITPLDLRPRYSDSDL